ncbi:MAG: hypothetical protein M9894_39235 [Planctomycetes bacterium]|nr:hypothetical protein [Planctomycetota bacterium]
METYFISTDGKEPRRVSSEFMEGNWTYHAYSMAHDGKANVVHRQNGIEVHRHGRSKVVLDMELPFNPRDFYWHPDSKRVAFWCIHTKKADRPGQLAGRTKAVAVMDVTRLTGTPRPGDPPPYDVIEVGRTDTTPFGLEWSPKGDAVYVIQRGLDVVNNETFSVITRVDLSDKKPRDIVRMPGAIDFFMPPVSRFERGEGPSNADYQIIYGHADGLFVVDPQGKDPQRLAQIPAMGLYNIEWNPRPNTKQVILFFRRPVRGRDGQMFVGAYLVRIDQLLRRAAQPEAAEPSGARPGIEQLYDDTDVHTLWYSPRGTYMTWATPSGVWYRRPDDPPEKTVLIQAPRPAEGAPALDVKGVTWHDNERKLAFTAGNKVFVVDLPSAEPKEVATIGLDTHTFLAEPRFVGDEIYLTAFEDARASGAVRSGLEFGYPGKPVDRSMGRDRSKAEQQPSPAPTQGGSGQRSR